MALLMGTDLRVTSPLRHFPEMNPDDTNRGVYLGDGVYALKPNASRALRTA